jgi:hypothetical protein
MTADTVLVGFDRHSIRFANQKLSYVAATRGRTSIRVLVENKADLCGIQDRTGEREAATAVFFPQSIVKKPTPKPFLKNWFGPVKREDPTIVMEG